MRSRTAQGGKRPSTRGASASQWEQVSGKVKKNLPPISNPGSRGGSRGASRGASRGSMSGRSRGTSESSYTPAFGRASTSIVGRAMEKNVEMDIQMVMDLIAEYNEVHKKGETLQRKLGVLEKEYYEIMLAKKAQMLTNPANPAVQAKIKSLEARETEAQAELDEAELFHSTMVQIKKRLLQEKIKHQRRMHARKESNREEHNQENALRINNNVAEIRIRIDSMKEDLGRQRALHHKQLSQLRKAAEQVRIINTDRHERRKTRQIVASQMQNDVRYNSSSKLKALNTKTEWSLVMENSRKEHFKDTEEKYQKLIEKLKMATGIGTPQQLLRAVLDKNVRSKELSSVKVEAEKRHINLSNDLEDFKEELRKLKKWASDRPSQQAKKFDVPLEQARQRARDFSTKYRGSENLILNIKHCFMEVMSRIDQIPGIEKLVVERPETAGATYTALDALEDDRKEDEEASQSQSTEQNVEIQAMPAKLEAKIAALMLAVEQGIPESKKKKKKGKRATEEKAADEGADEGADNEDDDAELQDPETPEVVYWNDRVTSTKPDLTLEVVDQHGVDYYEENLFRRQDMKDVSAANTRSATLAQKHGKEYSVFSPMAEKKKARRSSISSNRMADMATKGKSVSPKKKSVSPKKKHHA